MCSGSEEGSYLRLIDFCITLSPRCADVEALSVFWMDAWLFPLNRGYSKAILFDAYQVCVSHVLNTSGLCERGVGNTRSVLKTCWTHQVCVRHVLDTPGYSNAILFDAYQVCVTGVPRS